MSRVAVLFGATGLVGGECLKRLLASPRYGRVVVVSRRPSGQQAAKLDEVVTSLDALATVGERLRADDVFITLGTTIKKAGSQAAFRQVDYDLVVGAARACVERGAERMALVSSLGADPRSWVFYNRVKGEAEEAVRQLGYRALHLLRPSVLLGDRGEHRAGEAAAAALLRGVAPAMLGPLKRYRGVEASVVAAAMVRVVAEDRVGVHVYESEVVSELGAGG
jgi:uncharacterized protein YbjT (DUF2867 family)